MTKLYKQEEKEIQKAILDFLMYKKIKAWRNNSGMIFGKDSNGKSYGHRMGPAGSCDIIGILNDGRFLGIEVKRPGHFLTDLQKEFIDEINSKKGVAFCAHSIDETIEGLKKANYIV
jgi:hypothetical protein